MAASNPPATKTPLRWSQRLIKEIGPGGFSGVTFGDWLAILLRARFAVDVRYWPRAAFITANSCLNSGYRFLEWWRYSAAIGETTVAPPLFVLGYWRSGTTHLHNLLAVDDRFAFPNTYQVLFPHTFLSTETKGSAALARFMPTQRIMDNVKAGPLEPQEDSSFWCRAGSRACWNQQSFRETAPPSIAIFVSRIYRHASASVGNKRCSDFSKSSRSNTSAR